jgi:hypothetical protein
MLPFKVLFLYRLTDKIELCDVITKEGEILTKVVANEIVPSVILDKLENAVNLERGE